MSRAQISDSQLCDDAKPRDTGDAEPWAIDMSKVICINPIAEGATSQVFFGKLQGASVAVKLMTVPRGSSLPRVAELRRLFLREVRVWHGLTHPNVVKLLGASCDASPVLCPGDARPRRGAPFWAAVMELVAGGSLREMLDRRLGLQQPLSLQEALQLAVEAAKGMKYLHSRGVLHRDLKSANLLWEEAGAGGLATVKVADFGVARDGGGGGGGRGGGSDLTGGTGTLRWMAPEVISGRPYSEKVDVYSFGIVLWELLTCQLPYKGLTAAVIQQGVAEQDLRPEIPADCNPRFACLMRSCWDKEPQKRPDFNSILTGLLSIQADVGFPEPPRESQCAVM